MEQAVYFVNKIPYYKNPAGYRNLQSGDFSKTLSKPDVIISIDRDKYPGHLILYVTSTHGILIGVNLNDEIREIERVRLVSEGQSNTIIGVYSLSGTCSLYRDLLRRMCSGLSADMITS